MDAQIPEEALGVGRGAFASQTGDDGIQGSGFVRYRGVVRVHENGIQVGELRVHLQEGDKLGGEASPCSAGENGVVLDVNLGSHVGLDERQRQIAHTGFGAMRDIPHHRRRSVEPTLRLALPRVSCQNQGTTHDHTAHRHTEQP